jgi:hypothetical protein
MEDWKISVESFWERGGGRWIVEPAILDAGGEDTGSWMLDAVAMILDVGYWMVMWGE